MKMIEVLELREGLRGIGAKELPIKTAYKLSRIMGQVEAEAKHHDELRRRLFEKYGRKDPTNPGLLEIPPGARETFQGELNELLLLDVDLELEPCLSIDELGGVRVAPADLARIRALIVEPQEKE